MSEDKFVPMMVEQCEVFQSSYTNNVFDIILDDYIREPSYYRQAFHVLRTAQKGDRVNLIINNGGGSVNSAIMFINLIEETEAEVLAVLEGETHSAASMIALSAHGVHVKPFASMMIHNATFGTFNTVQNVIDHVNFTSTQTEKLIRKVYKSFLTEPEIEEVIRNREIWLTGEEIGERLDVMFEARKSEGCGDPSCTSCGPQGDDFEDFDLEALIAEKVAEGIEQHEKNKAAKEKAATAKSAKASKKIVEKVE
jgi:ATP-dependent protease ClpP protease subunit